MVGGQKRFGLALLNRKRRGNRVLSQLKIYTPNQVQCMWPSHRFHHIVVGSEPGSDAAIVEARLVFHPHVHSSAFASHLPNDNVLLGDRPRLRRFKPKLDRQCVDEDDAARPCLEVCLQNQGVSDIATGGSSRLGRLNRPMSALFGIEDCGEGGGGIKTWE